MNEADVRQEDVARAVACVRAHPKADSLGAFAYDVLDTQAEGRALFAGQKFMAQRAQSHGVDTDAAATDLGNLLGILERGPADRGEHALVAAFAARGFGVAYVAADKAHREQLAHKLASELDWLETATRYRLWACLRELLEPEPLNALLQAVSEAVLRDDSLAANDDPSRPAVRARNATRVSMLAAVASEPARSALSAIRADAKDPASRALAAVALGEPVLRPKAVAVRVFGRGAAVTRRPTIAVLRVISGVALVHALLRGVGFLLRYRRELEVELDGRVLRERRRSLVFGRTVRSGNAVYSLDRIRGAARSGRYALVRTLIGALSLSFGMLIGGFFAFDAARGGAAPLMAAGAALCGLGAALDLALDVLSSAARGQVQLRIDLSGARSIALREVPLADADQFLQALDAALSARAI